MFAVKVFTGDSVELTQPAIDCLTEYPNAGVELAFYNGEHFSHPAISTLVNDRPAESKIWHSDHRYISFASLISQDEVVRLNAMVHLAQEIEWARQFGIFKTVIHQVSNREKQPCLSSVLSAHEQWTPIFEYAHEQGVVLHFENTFETLAWMQSFFVTVVDRQYQDVVGLCLDIGHVRAFSYPVDHSNLEAWSVLTAYCRAHGLSLHYHIHSNDGSGDSHRALYAGHENGWLAPNESWVGGGLAHWLKKEKIAATPDTIFTLEVPSSQAYDDYLFANMLIEQ